MTRIILAAVLLLCSTAGLIAADSEELAARLKEVEKERDQLRRELALAKLKIVTLEDKLAAAGGAPNPKSTTNAAPSTKQGKEGDDDEVDEAGVAVKLNFWDVKVISMKPTDAKHLDGEIARLTSEVTAARMDIATGKRRLDSMRQQNEEYETEYERRKARGFAVGTKKKPYADEVLGEARLSIQKAETKERVAARRVLGLQREKAEASKTLIVTCESVTDGSTVLLMAKGGAYALAESMVAGRKYIVEGRKSGLDTVLLTKVTAASE